MTCTRRVRLANGREVSALDIQSEYLNRALRFAEHHDLTDEEQLALDMWEYTLSHLEDDPLKLDRELDWVIKYKLIEAYRERHDLALSDARVALVDLHITTSTASEASSIGCSARAWSTASSPTKRSLTPSSTRRRPLGLASGRVHQAGQRTQAGLHRRLGPPEAQRPGAAHRAVQGPVQSRRRTSRQADRAAVTGRGT